MELKYFEKVITFSDVQLLIEPNGIEMQKSFLRSCVCD